MNKELLVQNVKSYCVLRGVKPTVACRESGAGANFINKIKTQGSIPSVEKVQLLAQYLGVTTSELLGEPLPTAPIFPAHPDLALLYDQLSKEDQIEVMAFIKFKLAQGTKPVKGSVPLESLGDTCPAGVKEMDALKKEKTEDS